MAPEPASTVLPPPPGRPRSWPFAAALVLFVAGLGLAPHLRFSLLVGEATCFFSAYDEELYSLWALGGGGPLFPHRAVSSLALGALSWLAGSWTLALVLADAVFPAACAVLAWVLAGRVTQLRLVRLLLALVLLFAQELLSLGCWTVFQVGDLSRPALPDAAFYDLRWLRASLPELWQKLWPDYTAPFLTLLRTPEPQLSRIALFGAIVVLAGIAQAPPAARQPRRLLATGLGLNALLGFVHVSQGAALLVLEGLLGLAFLATGRRAAARTTLAFAGLGAASMALAALAHRSDAHAIGWSFATRLPILPPSVVAAVLGLAAIAWRRRALSADPLLPLAAACLGTVLVLTNQQLVTGRMVLSATWERYTSYTLVALAGAIVIAALLRRSRISLTTLYALSGAALLLAASVLLRAQDRVFEREYLWANLESVALERVAKAVADATPEGSRWLLEEPALALALEVRAGRRFELVLDPTLAFTRPVGALDEKPAASGVTSPHRHAVFEYLSRRPRTAAAAARQLEREGASGNGDLLWFLFDIADFWAPMTDGRRTRLSGVRAQLPALGAAYSRYLDAGDPCWRQPVVVLTRQSLEERRSERWSESFLAQAEVGRTGALMNMHAYLQRPSPETAALPGVATGTCPGSAPGSRH